MAISNDNQQIAVILPKEIVKKLDELAAEEMRTRSQQAAKILVDYFKNQEK